MRNLKEVWRKLGRQMMIPVLAVATLVSLVAYESVRPVAAKAAVAAVAAPLDDESISPLLSLDKAMETLAARVTPAIVNVAVTSHGKADEAMEMQIPEGMQQMLPPGFGRQMPSGPRVEHGIGSGVIISPDGYIVTNNHVIDGAVEIRVTMSDRRILNAKLVGADPLTDVAVIKVEGTNLPSIPWGDSTLLQPGQTVLAFGNPWGFRFTVTRGIVSALNRPRPMGDDPRKPGQYIQTDAAINPGNSGGPLVSARGEVVGINTFLYSPSGAFSGMGFAIPTQIVKPTVDSLIRNGKVSHGYMGIGISDVTPENAKFFHVNDANGAVVSQVEANSPASKAGLKTGDVIRELDGQKVSDAGDLQVQVGQKQPGMTIKLGVLRDGSSVNVAVKLEEMGSRDKNDNTVGENERGKMRWGLGLSDITPEVREQLQAPETVHGAVVERVQPGSSAEDAGLQRGDVIVEVNRHAVEGPGDVQQELGKVAKGQDALVLVWSNGGSSFRVLHAPQG